MKQLQARKCLLLCLTGLLCVFCLLSCGTASEDQAIYDGEVAAPGDAGNYADDFGNGATGAEGDALPEAGLPGMPLLGNGETTDGEKEARKVVKTANLYGETLDFEEFMAKLEQTVISHGAYVGSSRTSSGGSGRNGRDLKQGTLVIRVPADRFDSFATQLKTLCNVLDFEENANDVTMEYVDVESRIKAYRAQETALLAMLEKAETVADLITVEERLSQVRYEIESYQSRLNVLSSSITYSTVTVNIHEVEDETVAEYPSVFREIGAKFSKNLTGVGEGLRAAFVFAVSGIPYLLPLLALSLIAALILLPVNRRGRKKRKEALAQRSSPEGSSSSPKESPRE